MKTSSGKARHNVIIGLMLLGVVGYIGWVYAQVATQSDPCAVYPHQTINLPAPAATGTVKAVAGVLNKQIYVCAVHVQQVAGSTPGLTLAYGQVAAATPCATAGATLGTYGSVAAGSTVNVGGTTTVAIAPAASGTPVTDLCTNSNPANFVSGSLEYVQR